MREICNVVHRTVLTRPDSPAVQASALQVLQLVLICATEKLEMAKRRMLTQELGVPANKQPARDSDEYRKAALLGEGGEEGNIDHATSVILAALEVCFCVLIRYHPDLSPGASGLTSTSAGLIGRSSGNSHNSSRATASTQRVDIKKKVVTEEQVTRLYFKVFPLPSTTRKNLVFPTITRSGNFVVTQFLFFISTYSEIPQ